MGFTEKSYYSFIIDHKIDLLLCDINIFNKIIKLKKSNLHKLFTSSTIPDKLNDVLKTLDSKMIDKMIDLKKHNFDDEFILKYIDKINNFDNEKYNKMIDLKNTSKINNYYSYKSILTLTDNQIKNFIKLLKYGNFSNQSNAYNIVLNNDISEIEIENIINKRNINKRNINRKKINF